jgi:hypothetical protein
MARIRRALLYFGTLLVVVYVADFATARFHPLGSMQVAPYYAIHLKNKKVEFDFDVPKETQSCVVSLVPHFGYPPCWYLKKHTVERIDE